LVIGVTGHRDLRSEDLPELEQLVRGIIETFKRDLPHTPLVLLSALAEGADCLVARVALELGARLIVPLPVRQEIYSKDFSTPDSRAEFAKLLDKAEYWFELPLLEGATEKAIDEDGAPRNHQYEQLGAYIVRQSHLLLALWDGEYRNLIGGTSQIVRFQLEGVPPPYAPRFSSIDTPESGPVYHIVTPRKGNPKPASAPFTLRKLFPKGYVREADRFDRIWARVDKFNDDLIRHADLLGRRARKSAADLIPDRKADELPPALQSIRQRFAVADTLAIYFQRLTKATLKLLLFLVLLIAVCFDLYAHFFSTRHWLLAVYLVLQAVAYLWIYQRAKSQDYQNKYQDYRALAEGMRVQFFWRLSGLDLSVGDHYLRKQRSELDWICSAIRAWNLPGKTKSTRLVNQAGTDSRKTLELVREHWVTDQLRFFVSAAHENNRKLERYDPYVQALLRMVFTVVILVTLALSVPHPWRLGLYKLIEEHRWLHGLLLTLISFPAIGAGLLDSYTEKKALSEHAKQYSRMSMIFDYAWKQLSQFIKNGDHQRAWNLIAELGKEALVENADWLTLHRARPLELPPEVLLHDHEMLLHDDDERSWQMPEK
jgi:hypothetical protein